MRYLNISAEQLESFAHSLDWHNKSEVIKTIRFARDRIAFFIPPQDNKSAHLRLIQSFLGSPEKEEALAFYQTIQREDDTAEEIERLLSLINCCPNKARALEAVPLLLHRTDPPEARRKILMLFSLLPAETADDVLISLSQFRIDNRLALLACPAFISLFSSLNPVERMHSRIDYPAISRKEEIDPDFYCLMTEIRTLGLREDALERAFRRRIINSFTRDYRLRQAAKCSDILQRLSTPDLMDFTKLFRKHVTPRLTDPIICSAINHLVNLPSHKMREECFALYDKIGSSSDTIIEKCTLVIAIANTPRAKEAVEMASLLSFPEDGIDLKSSLIREIPPYFLTREAKEVAKAIQPLLTRSANRLQQLSYFINSPIESIKGFVRLSQADAFFEHMEFFKIYHLLTPEEWLICKDIYSILYHNVDPEQKIQSLEELARLKTDCPHLVRGAPYFEKLREQLQACSVIFTDADNSLQRYRLFTHVSQQTPEVQKEIIDSVQAVLSPFMTAEDRKKLILAVTERKIQEKETLMDFLIHRAWDNYYANLPTVHANFDHTNRSLFDQLQENYQRYPRARLSISLDSAADVGGVTRDVLQTCANNMQECFAAILVRNRDGSYQLQERGTGALQEARFLGRLLFEMAVNKVSLPATFVLSPEFYKQLSSFPKDFLAEENSLSEICEEKGVFYVHERLFGKIELRTLMDIFGVETNQELLEEMRKRIEQQSIAFEVAKYFSCFGFLKPHPIYSTFFCPQEDLRTALVEKTLITGSGDLGLLRRYFTTWVIDAEERYLKLFLRAASGLESLPEGQSITMSASSNLTRTIFGQTCFFKLYVPQISREESMDYRAWREWLEDILLQACQGFGRA